MLGFDFERGVDVLFLVSFGGNFWTEQISERDSFRYFLTSFENSLRFLL